MPFGQWLIVKIPGFFLLAIMLLISVGFSVSGLLIMRRFLSHQKRKTHNDVAGPIFSTIGVVYAVLLTFVVVIVWEAFDRVNVNVEGEADCLSDLYNSAAAFPNSKQIEIRNMIEEYRKAVIKDEWPLLAVGQKSELVSSLHSSLWKFYAAYQPSTKTEEIFLGESVSNLNRLSDLRKERLVNSKTGISGSIWAVLIIGGIITVFFSFLFGAEHHGLQLLMTVLLAALISLILYTIMQLDYPFSGAVCIKPVAFETIAQMR